MDDIPQWAKERVIELADAEDWQKVPALATAFARYIAAHEEPPIDPLLVEARQLCAEHSADESDIADFLGGKNDSGISVPFALAALKRGIELAREARP